MSKHEKSKFIEAVWVSVNHLIKKLYKFILRRFPRVALWLKAVFYSALKSANLKVLHRPYAPVLKGKNADSWLTQYQQNIDDSFRPLVTVIVPNYNHQQFLRQRLESIYSQTYKNYEVILMDDCSQDNSREILEEFAANYPENTSVVFNESNSGGVFYQWEKGLKLANGDLVWIAESDDWCDANFLQTLVPCFGNESVQLAYSKTIFMDGKGEKQIWSINEYLHDIDTEKWHHEYFETANKSVAGGFALKNIIPNVSSAVFKKPDQLEIIQSQEWKSMRTCGDWLLYIYLIRGGSIAYSPHTTNYYRIHDKNTSVASYSQDSFYKEHETIAKAICQYYTVDIDIFFSQKQNLINHWRTNRKKFSQEHFNECYSLEKISNYESLKKPNILMAGYAFCAGGGETFPIQLANLLKANGYNITYLDCTQEPREPEIKNGLRKDIAVVSSLYELEAIVNDFAIDIIHSHHAWVDNCILDILPENLKCNTIVTTHGMYEMMDDKFLNSIIPRLVERSSKIVYTAEKNTFPFKKHNLFDDEKFVKIDNSLDIYEYETIDRNDFGIPEDAFLLTLISRSVPEKGWPEAIESVQLARELSGEDIRLILIGEGPVYNKLKRSSIPDFVYVLGFQSNVRSFFAASDMGFLPSRFEGESFPLVIIECLHAGRPVLASAIGEIPYMLENTQGMAGELFDLDNWEIPIEKLANKIVRLSSDKKYYSKLLNNVPLAAKKFDPNLMYGEYSKVYQSL